jgi:hypothetical protein
LHDESMFHEAYVGSVTDTAVFDTSSTLTGGDGGNAGPVSTPPLTIVEEWSPLALLALA